MLLSAIIYGFCLLQAFLYFQSNFPFSVPRNDLSYIPEYANDPWYTKTAVGLSITTPDLTNQCCTGANSYYFRCNTPSLHCDE